MNATIRQTHSPSRGARTYVHTCVHANTLIVLSRRVSKYYCNSFSHLQLRMRLSVFLKY